MALRGIRISRARRCALYRGDGTIGHAELELEGATIFLSTPSPYYEGPKRHREHCGPARRWNDNEWVIDGLFVEVTDVDAHHERAAAAGPVVLPSPEDIDAVGFRLYTVEDPEGHRWMFGQRLGR